MNAVLFLLWISIIPIQILKQGGIIRKLAEAKTVLTAALIYWHKKE